MCQTAYDEFNFIVNTVGGPNERQRAQELFKQVCLLANYELRSLNIQSFR